MAKAVLTACARILGAHLAEFGFEPDRYVFRRYNAAGDAILVDLQPHTSFSGETRFYVNVAFLLAPVWEWDRQRYHYPPAKRPDTSHGSWFDRVNPSDAEDDFGQWVIEDGSETEAVAGRVFARLRERLADMLPWLDRDHLRRVAGDRDVLGYAAEQVKAWLLAEGGTSEELREILFGSSSPDAAEVRDVDRAIWEYARRHDGSSAVR
ncbi:DUF4304 domain-containing protein [Actinoplanes oblitus]|uniref:DUF4304 domain-containing protein n=1 Tax=Actinoplanes oblitus TaxID=3040509 RepID=A0ABY8WEY7_9ACTN|nr:DUF4304 domain-containing protein [Actinoplanes oblitus]WIM96409.1 DUF4304 domain-containing protein [Actinoplanes oblitus]